VVPAITVGKAALLNMRCVKETEAIHVDGYDINPHPGILIASIEFICHTSTLLALRSLNAGVPDHKFSCN